MANEQEEIIIIDDQEAAAFEHNKEQIESLGEDDDAKKTKIIIIVGGVLALILIVTIIILLLFKNKKTPQNITQNPIEKKLNEKTKKSVKPSQIENMIAKANYLYLNGSKTKALHIYEKIATYSEAISLYNLGVAQLKDNQYKKALTTFKKAIKNDDNRCVSAINAAVCSLHIKDNQSFHYYIDLAKSYLPSEINSPLYSYYYALINYYQDNYLEALSALQHPTSKEYPKVQRALKVKIDALFNNNYDAIDSLEKGLSDYDDLSIGLLYARIGDYTLAINHLEKSIEKNIHPVRSQLALGLIKLKANRIAEGAKEIKNVTDMFPNKVYKYYPINVKLKDSLFDPTLAQYHYKEKIMQSKFITYEKIFYFAPYKVFNANKTINYIRKGTANIYVDDAQSAQEYLKKSASSSNVNLGIVKAINEALSFKLKSANELLKKLVKIQPKHSILHYDLALTYAQLGDMRNAYKHFIRSYHLDAKNHTSGIFAVMCAQLIDKQAIKLTSIVSNAIADEDDSEKNELHRTLLFLAKNDYISAIDWLDNNFKQRPLYLALSSIIALKLHKIDRAKDAALKLTFLLPRDIVPHIIYSDALFYDDKPVSYAKHLLNYLKKQNFQFDDLYYGPYLTRYLYIQQNLLTGKLYFLRMQLKNVLETTSEDKTYIVQALALASLYDRAFEESYTLYNTLIDDFRVRDAKTLFLGAVASTAAKHHANAIALLELSKMKDKNFLESRYALGLLYLEVENNQGGVIQLSKIVKSGFDSEYFDFEIDTKKLLFQKEHKK
jgi:tetratricopeptide (TPR) repeat protein